MSPYYLTLNVKPPIPPPAGCGGMTGRGRHQVSKCPGTLGITMADKQTQISLIFVKVRSRSPASEKQGTKSGVAQNGDFENITFLLPPSGDVLVSLCARSGAAGRCSSPRFCKASRGDLGPGPGAHLKIPAPLPQPPTPKSQHSMLGLPLGPQSFRLSGAHPCRGGRPPRGPSAEGHKLSSAPWGQERRYKNTSS